MKFYLTSFWNIGNKLIPALQHPKEKTAIVMLVYSFITLFPVCDIDQGKQRARPRAVC